ncbi:MAG: putative lipid II flippase FtsW [Acidimicrobiales bacterium]
MTDASVARPSYRSSVKRMIHDTLGVVERRDPGGWGTAQVVVIILVALLNIIGLAMVLSVSSVTATIEGNDTWYYFVRQSLWISMGTVALVVLRSIDYHIWRRFVPLALVITFAMLMAVLVPGIGLTVNGARRWLGVGPLTVQPTELFKLTMLVYTADLMARRSHVLDSPRKTLVPVLVVFGAGGALIMLQPDLGSVIVAGGITTAVLFAGGVRLAPLAGGASAGLALAAILAIAAPYRRARVMAFIDPWESPDSIGYQNIQSLVGIASGGVTGVGIGEGRVKWGYLPEAHTDFIFAVVAEEMGLVGSLLVLSLFVLIAVMGIRIALRAPDRFGTLVAIGIVVWLVTQAIVNIGAVVGVLPITGIPLPFVSFGGTSLVVGMAAVGLLLQIGRQGRA